MLSTNPPSGTKVNQGCTVTLTVSSGPANVTVPSLIGLSPERRPARPWAVPGSMSAT